MKEVKISVRNLVESMLMTGSIGGEFRLLSPDRAEEGSRVHRLHQERQLKKYPEYQKEVTLKETFCLGDDLTITVDGRADGYLPGQFVEEIKSTYLSGDALAEYENPLHWAQVKFYALMILHREKLDEIDLQLTYFQIETEEVSTRFAHYRLEELEEFCQEVLDLQARFIRLNMAWEASRNESIGGIQFPFPKYRPGQRELAVAVYGTIRDNKKLFVQAPTGIGKTISTLFPAVKALREKKTDRIFYLTPKSTGKAIGEESIARMRQSGAKLRSLTLTSKEKICFMEEVRCEPEYCPYAKDYYDKVTQAKLTLLEKEDSMSKDVLEDYARRYEICPFEFSLDCSLYADIILCDYNYAYDPRVYLKRFFEEKRERYTFLVDEAHNLLDRARSMFSAQIDLDSFQLLAKNFKKICPAIAKASQKVAKALEGLEGLLDDKGRFTAPHCDEAILFALENFRGACEAYLQDEEEMAKRDANKERDQEIQDHFLDTYFLALAFLRIAEIYGQGHMTYAQKIQENLYLKLFCIDPAKNLSEASTRADATIFFSATLSPMNYFEDLYGREDKDYRMMLASPFPAENLTVYLDQTIDTRYKVRDDSYEAISENLARLLRRKKGNYVVFFPSYRYLDAVYEGFVAHYQEEFEIHRQDRGLSESQRLEVLAQFDGSRDQSMIYFLVLGGVFAEGIDLKGDRLIGCAVVGLGYPQFDFERELIQGFFEATKGEGFSYAYTFPGINKITQAGGRVIRDEADQGVLLLMDRRYGRRDIAKLLPPSWAPLIPWQKK